MPFAAAFRAVASQHEPMLPQVKACVLLTGTIRQFMVRRKFSAVLVAVAWVAEHVLDALPGDVILAKRQRSASPKRKGSGSILAMNPDQ